jgi:phospholipid/cholesterol/gamma-HCH transport system substrate-binding protein
MRGRWTRNARYLATICVLAVSGTVLAAYVLLKERFPNPTVDTYQVSASFSRADGVSAGVGQPVTVAGVNVGAISGERLYHGDALVTFTIKSGQLPHVYRDATAALRPITPLKDMEIELDPGHPRAGILPLGGTLPLARTSAPIDLEDLLSAFDADTRTFLASLISSVGAGTAGRGLDIRNLLLALGPTTAQVRSISVALASRRHAIARLVHNLAVVTRAASEDGQLTAVVQAGNETLQAVAAQDAPLSQAVKELPSTLRVTSSTLATATGLSRQLGPSLDALTPAVRRLPKMLAALRPFADQVTPIVRDRIRPLARAAQPLVSPLGPAVARLSAMTPKVQGVFQLLNYFVNELAYNPGGGNPGMLFWAAWLGHNLNEFASLHDANGGLGRGIFFVSCSQVKSLGALGQFLGQEFGVSGVCGS